MFPIKEDILSLLSIVLALFEGDNPREEELAKVFDEDGELLQIWKDYSGWWDDE